MCFIYVNKVKNENLKDIIRFYKINLFTIVRFMNIAEAGIVKNQTMNISRWSFIYLAMLFVNEQIFAGLQQLLTTTSMKVMYIWLDITLFFIGKVIPTRIIIYQNRNSEANNHLLIANLPWRLNYLYMIDMHFEMYLLRYILLIFLAPSVNDFDS